MRRLLVSILVVGGCSNAPTAECTPSTSRACTTCVIGDCCMQLCTPGGVWGECAATSAPCHDAGPTTDAASPCGFPPSPSCCDYGTSPCMTDADCTEPRRPHCVANLSANVCAADTTCHRM